MLEDKYIVLFTINGENKWLEFDDVSVLNATISALKQLLGHLNYKIIKEEV